MGDLISRSALIENFRKCYSGHMGMENSDSTMMFKSICRVINEQPTAYNVDAVVAELEQQAEQYRNRGFEHEQKGFSTMADKYYGKQCSYLHAIEIVKRGGVE